VVTALVVIAVLGTLALPITAIICAAGNKKLKVEGKLGWSFGILFTGPIGAAVYFLAHGRSILVRAFNGMILLASFAAIAVFVNWWNKSGFGKILTAAVSKDLGDLQALAKISGRYQLKYITCKDPKSVTAQGQQMNLELKEGVRIEHLEVRLGSALYSGRFLNKMGGECGISHRHKLINKGNRWSGEAGTIARVNASGGFDRGRCDGLAQAAREPWVRNFVPNPNHLYLHDPLGSQYCGDAQAYFVYDKAEPERAVAGMQPDSSAVGQSADVRSAKLMREAFESLKRNEFDQAIARAEEARALTPAKRGPAAVISAAQKIKQDPNNVLVQSSAMREVIDATVEDSKQVFEELKNALGR